MRHGQRQVLHIRSCVVRIESGERSRTAIRTAESTSRNRWVSPRQRNYGWHIPKVEVGIAHGHEIDRGIARCAGRAAEKSVRRDAVASGSAKSDLVAAPHGGLTRPAERQLPGKANSRSEVVVIVFVNLL